jgi:hypothetical protein
MLALTFASALLSTSLAPSPALALEPAWSTASVIVCLVGVAIALVASLWAVCERMERIASQQQSRELSISFQAIVEQHYRERLQAEERHLLSFDSAMRNTLESLERSALGKPKP